MSELIVTITPKMATDCLREAFRDDPDYAHGWHCNIAMACYDAFGSTEEMRAIPHDWAHALSNEAASRFMKLAFDVETSADPSEDKDND